MIGEAGSGSGAHAILLILILLFAGAVRFYDLGKNSFWHGEFLSLQSSSGQNTWLMTLPANMLLEHPPTLTRLDRSAPWQRLWRVEDGEIHPAVYFILLRFWREAFGNSEFAVPPPGRSVWMICYQADLAPEAIFPNGRVLQQMLLPNVGRFSQVASR
jgi:hypothetical protein